MLSERKVKATKLVISVFDRQLQMLSNWALSESGCERLLE